MAFIKKFRYILISIVVIFFVMLYVKDFTFAANPWNNNNFINDSFWRNNPSDIVIKEAIFGNASDNKTAYTQERNSNVCSTGTINIVNVQNYATSGVNSLIQTLTANTIYVLNSGTYITSGQISYGGSCIAVIGKGTTKMYSSIALNSGASISAMFKSNGKDNIILSNLSIDGLNDGLGTYRFNGSLISGNSYGIYFYNTKNANINYINSYNNRNGIQIELAESVVVINSLVYNNGIYGINILSNSKPNYVINSQIFNNNSVGLTIRNSTGNVLSNSQFYNNKFQGIVLDNAKSGSISNCMSYNNSWYGIRFQNNSSNNIINNSWFYNNSTTGVFVESGVGNKYYGSIKLFNNASSANANTLVGGISAGSSLDIIVSGLGRSDGIVDTGLSVGYPYITNPKTNDGRDLISGTAWSSTNRSNKARTGIEFVSFTYGTGIIKQDRSVSYGTPSYTLSNSFYDNNKYIAQIDFTNINPDGFTFDNITGASLNQIYTSNIIILTGMDSGTWEYIYVNGRGTIFKNGSNIGTSGTGSNGDQFYIQTTSSSNYYTIRSGSLVVGTTSADFTITTLQQIIDDIPDNFSFDNITDAELNQIYTSNIITLTGMASQAEINISVSGRGTIFKNGSNIGTATTGANGDQFYIQITSSNNYNALRSGSFLANVVASEFIVTTKPDLIFPIFSGVITGTTYSEPVSIIFSDSNLSGATLNGNVYTNGTEVSSVGDYVFEVSDTAGNVTGASFRISIPKTITITFDTNISTGTVTKAPVKYNKDIAYGMVYDDGLDDGYQPAFKYLNGGQISGWNNNFIAPGLYYTDGAGNDVAFRGGYARYSVNSAWNDLHLTTPSYIKWTELKDTYINGRDVLNHGRSSAAYPSSGQLYNYPDNPPGTTGLDYSYEISKAYEYVRDHIGLSGVYMTHFILPSGDPAYTQPAREQGYKSVSSQGINNGNNGINIYDNVDLYHFQMHRKFVTSQNSDFSNIMNDIDTLMTNSSNATTKLWRQSFTHGVIFTGNNNGGIDFTLWKYLMDNIADNYGKNGSDKIWFAGPQEVYEYVATKQGTNISTTVSGNQLIINLDTLNVPTDLRRESLSLLVTGTNANISSISYQNGAFSYHTENKVDGLINLEMGDYYLTDRNPDSFNLGNQTNASTGQSYNSNTITLTGMSAGLDNIIYLSGAGTIYKNGSSIGSSATGKNGDQFYVRLAASNNPGETLSTVMKIGLQSKLYSITTQANQQLDDIIDLPSGNTVLDMNTRLIASGYNSGTGSIRTNIESFVVGRKSIRTRDSLGKILAAMIMQSSGNNIIEAQIPQWTIVKTANNNLYTGIINRPEELSTNNISLANVVYAASFGSTGESINFEDMDYMPVNVTIRLPAPGKNEGDPIDIYYSEDNGGLWNFHTGTNVVIIGGEPYAEFTTNHFTDFAVTLPEGQGGGSFTGTFVINNDAASTSSTGVTLNMSTTPAATHMRFSDDGSSRSSRETYATSKSRTLPGTYGTKTVYVQFDANNDSSGDAQTSDSIEYISGSTCGGGGIGEACLSLEITAVTGECRYGVNLDLGDHTQTYNAFTMTGAFTGNNGTYPLRRSCNDT
ncbi:MAG: right-handed parallel beta-helix repeat-containing protein, partial [Candidatus Absconditicoccaceae bacterium]